MIPRLNGFWSSRQWKIWFYAVKTPEKRSVDLEPSGSTGTRKTKKTSENGCLFVFFESARRDSNPRPRPWQGRAPPTEPLAHVSVSQRQGIVYQRQWILSILFWENIFSEIYFLTFLFRAFWRNAIMKAEIALRALSAFCDCMGLPRQERSRKAALFMITGV